MISLAQLVTGPNAVHASAQNYRQFQRGMTYLWWSTGTYLTQESDESIEALAATGTNWVSLIVTWYEQTYSDTLMLKRNYAVRGPTTPSDDSVIHAIRTIHSTGMKVMLRPIIDLVDQGLYRELLQPRNVTEWFRNYRAFILHYLKMANAEGVEQFCIGAELTSMEPYTQGWVDLIEFARANYNGTLTYSSLAQGKTWDNDQWKQDRFWNKLDYVGLDVYFPLTNKADPTLNELREEWVAHVNDIEAFQATVRKPIVFVETGWHSVAGTNTGTWKWNRVCNPNDNQYDPSECKPDQQEQANLYEALLETFWNKPYLQGIFWWAWYPYGQRPGWGEGGPNDANFSPHNKLAEKVLRSWYAKPFIPQGSPQEAVPALVAIQSAENATSDVVREGRTRGLDQARNLLSQSIDMYDRGDYGHSEALANDAIKSASNAVSQKEYDEASTAVDQALQSLNAIRNATLHSTEALHIKQQAEVEYTSALGALNGNQLDLAKSHAANSTALVEKALTAEHDFGVRQTMLRQQQEQNWFLSLFALGIVVTLALFAIVVAKSRRRKLMNEVV